jgi:hypothetical protein
VQKEVQQRDHEYGRAYVAALILQHLLEIAEMPVQATQAREIRSQVELRLLSLYAVNRPAEDHEAA